MKHIFLLCVFVLFFACNSIEKKDVEVEKNKKEYIMYEPSEMSLLMNEMYEINLKIKGDILAGNIPNQFPESFLEIHTAQLTDSTVMDDNFESFSKLFIQSEKEIFNTSSEFPIEDRFNNMVNLCISCHTTHCTGPIPRIKKLLIE